MSRQRAEHGTVIIERLLDAPPSRACAAFAAADGKARWLGGRPLTVPGREFHFRDRRLPLMPR